MSEPQTPELTEREWEVARWWLRPMDIETVDIALGLPEGEARRHWEEIVRKVTGSPYNPAKAVPLDDIATWVLENDPNPPDWYDWYSKINIS